MLTTSQIDEQSYKITLILFNQFLFGVSLEWGYKQQSP
jgi:hypothetical protein